MPRRIPDYPDAYAGWNYVASIGSLISLISVLILIWVIYSMCYYNENKPKLKNNVWIIESYYTLAYNKLTNSFNELNELLEKSKTNNSSLEFSIKTPADYHSFTQAPIMGSLPLVGFASWSIMSIASILTYIVVGGGLGNVYTHSGVTLIPGLIYTAITGLIMTLLVLFLTKSKTGDLSKSKWASFGLFIISAFLIILTPYVIGFDQIVETLYDNLHSITTYVDADFTNPIITPLDYQGVLLDISQWSDGTLNIFNFLFITPLIAIFFSLGLKLGSFALNYCFSFTWVKTKKIAAYLVMVFACGFVFIIPYISILFSFLNEGVGANAKSHQLSSFALAIVVTILTAIAFSIGLKLLVLKLMDIIILIINKIYKKSLTKPAILYDISTILAITAFFVYILNDIYFLLNFKTLCALIY